MLDIADFIPAVRAAIPRFQARPGRGPAPDAQQEACVTHRRTVPLQIVAGPGSGKTTVLVLRALRFILVDGLLPEQVVLTTFTRKAADEIRTRLVEWGLQLITHLRTHGPASVQSHLAQIDVNRFVTGTLDAICEDALRSLRAATDPAPSLLEGFAANALMHRKGLTGPVYQAGSLVAAVAPYLQRFTFDGTPPGNVAELVSVMRPLFDRFSHDLVNVGQFRVMPVDTPARAAIAAAYDAYVAHLRSTNRLDFALLEYTFLDRLRSGRLQRFTDTVKAVLVDEYQDTNLLQESIYFGIAANASLTVVGDDDQSLYRFRGATVELFRDFRARLGTALVGTSSQRLDLTGNYRSTPEIVSFFNSFVTNDPDFAGARVHPPKPAIQARLPANGVPILGMFRPTAAALANDVAGFIHDVFRGRGRRVPGPSGSVTITAAAEGGDIGDAVLLAHSVNEFTQSFMGQPPKARFPNLLRTALGAHNIQVFNPRGQALRDISDVQRLVGAMLECLDPGAAIEGAMRLTRKVSDQLARFRTEYAAYAGTNPSPSAPHGLAEFVRAWGARRPQVRGMPWPREWPLLELCFTLLSWFPRLRDDPEGQVHIEAISRAIAQSATFSAYRALVLHGVAPHDNQSVQSAIRDIFGQLADGSVDVDEEIMPSVPRDRFAIMTIHQAKGLEFPLVIVDVSSDFGRNHPKNRFKRFPEQPSNQAAMEDDLAPVCSVGALRQMRTGLQRTFEDLIRLHYVAFSRPQSALLLVGLDPCLQYRTTIRHVGHFWRANGTWAWTAPYTGGRAPPMANAIPMELI